MLTLLAFLTHSGQVCESGTRLFVPRRMLDELQKTCGVKPRFDISLDAGQVERMVGAVKTDPAGLFYPLPDNVIRGTLESVFDRS